MSKELFMIINVVGMCAIAGGLWFAVEVNREMGQYQKESWLRFCTVVKKYRYRMLAGGYLILIGSLVGFLDLYYLNQVWKMPHSFGVLLSSVALIGNYVVFFLPWLVNKIRRKPTQPIFFNTLVLNIIYLLYLIAFFFINIMSSLFWMLWR